MSITDNAYYLNDKMKKILVLFTVLALFACNKKVVDKPDNLLDKNIMIDILFDIALLQAAESNYSFQMDQEGLKANEFIYKKYGIDSVTFAQNNRYYASDPREYKKMYGEVFHRFELEKEKLNKASVETTGKTIAPSDAPAIQ
ncbi:DUF4296 domain-containing protein [Flavobacterium sp.]|uniref:DUF4296 domain-containing protein n=1 Tax=Flavobacterium sp. TaxID=239 RepID=UPI0028BF0796|nr:DUF4296 domain-containing protein [Flavobacterium sp.]